MTDQTRRKPETVVHVTDRTYEAMKLGARFDYWPGTGVPDVGTRICVFDCNLDFTQHDVVQVAPPRVWIGPAIPWAERDEP